MMTSGKVRWAVPAVAAACIAAGVGVYGGMSAGAAPSLPNRGAQQLIANVAGAKTTAMSGTIVQRSDLGLPSLPGVTSSGGGGDATGLPALLTGSHTVRLWVDGADKIRVAQLATLGEADVIRNGSTVWVWDSQKNSANRCTIPAATGRSDRPSIGAEQVTPQALASKVLDASAATTTIRASGTASVAGRDAYLLTATPKTAGSLVGSVQLAVDARTFVPLRVRLYAKGDPSPAVEVGFSHISFASPSATEFAFNPPPKTTVGACHLPNAATLGRTQTQRHASATRQSVRTVGSGWTSVAVINGVADRMGNSSLHSVLSSLPRVSGSWGSGRLFSSRLVTALITDDGRVLVGPVPAATLYAAAGGR